MVILLLLLLCISCDPCLGWSHHTVILMSRDPPGRGGCGGNDKFISGLVTVTVCASSKSVNVEASWLSNGCFGSRFGGW